jgi:hypothetical protein
MHIPLEGTVFWVESHSHLLVPGFQKYPLMHSQVLEDFSPVEPGICEQSMHKFWSWKTDDEATSHLQA